MRKCGLEHLLLIIVIIVLTSMGIKDNNDSNIPNVDSIFENKIETPHLDNNDSLPRLYNIQDLDSIGSNEKERYLHLTENDFDLVADELQIEKATIKAVVEIEAGTAMKGFWAPGIPVINFDDRMFIRYKSKTLVTEAMAEERVPDGLTGYALKEWTQLINARKKNAIAANMATFWGMFQIGGFNYKLCGCESVNEFVRRIAYSELEQLQLFAIFINNTGLVEYLKKKDWSGFAKRYNGPSYARRGYHTKMAKAYAKYSK